MTKAEHAALVAKRHSYYRQSNELAVRFHEEQARIERRIAELNIQIFASESEYLVADAEANPEEPQ